MAGIIEMSSPEEQLETLERGTAKIFSSEELLEKLRSGKPLRVKLGVDPTAPDIHLGHTVVLEKLRQFQILGHQAVLIIGDFTATVGDPTGRSSTRPPLTRQEVLVNAETYTDQAFKILDRDSTEVVYNGDWFRGMPYEDVLKLNARVTMQQMLQREDFKNRIDGNKEVRLHEMQYPVMQGWDSVEVRADIELGGTDQLFNILVGRDMQKSQGMSPQVAMCLPILEGTDGARKMSKSYDNYIGVDEAPAEMFGKAMSISDELMDRWYTLLLGSGRDLQLHPMEAKKQLAARIVARYHDEEAAVSARADFEAKFAKGDGEVEWPEVELGEERRLIASVAIAFKDGHEVQRSNSEIRRLIQQGGVQLDGEKFSDPSADLPGEVAGKLLRLDKKRSVRLL
ncbi:MAG: tyrosine--tRNA ligase [Verrucomicrobiales bacterium]|nr:tyrosine--tRNA ligase [Verrucomicrobiales bacterium]